MDTISNSWASSPFGYDFSQVDTSFLDNMDISDEELNHFLAEAEASPSPTWSSSPHVSNAELASYDAEFPHQFSIQHQSPGAPQSLHDYPAANNSGSDYGRPQTDSPIEPPRSEESIRRARRREQNRKAQRAFRDRQEQRYRTLQVKYDDLLAKHIKLIQTCGRQDVDKRRLLAAVLEKEKERRRIVLETPQNVG